MHIGYIVALTESLARLLSNRRFAIVIGPESLTGALRALALDHPVARVAELGGITAERTAGWR